MIYGCAQMLGIKTPSLFGKDNAVVQFLEKNPSVKKVMFVAIHFFRAASMFALMKLLPVSGVVALCIGSLLSDLYRAAIEEKSCQYRFAVEAFWGGFSFTAAEESVALLTTKVAFNSLENGFTTSLGIVSLVAYTAYIIHISDKAANCCNS